MEKIVCQKQTKLIDFLREKFNSLSYSNVQKLLRQKSIKVNGTRTKDNILLEVGDQVEVFASAEKLTAKPIQIVFEDDNICVANKPVNIEVCDGNDKTLLSQLSTQLDKELFAVHRIDRNTTGLVVFAKNQTAKAELEQAFKEHKIQKYYFANVFGVPAKKSDKLVAYLKKDAKNSVVSVSSESKAGYSKIITNYQLIETNGDISKLNILIETGKTHQIRAHLAHIGLPIVGDEKYGDKEKNRQHKKHRQMLEAYKLVFNIDKGYLKYLNNKSIEI